MNSGLTFLTSGSSPIAITSSTVTRTRLPARSPPACRLVCPGNDDHGSVGERAAEPGVERAAEAVAVGQQHDDRNDAPRNAEHRQRRAEAVVVEAVERLRDDLAQYRRIVTSRSAAPRPAAAPPPAAPDRWT